MNMMTETIDESDPWPEMTDAPAMTPTARATFRATLADVAARAKAHVPAAVNGRIERATRLVLQHDVRFLPDGTVEVGSSSDPMKVYHLRGRTCECKDFTEGKAPDGFCQHILAACIYQRVEQALRQPAPAAEAPQVAPEPTEPVQGVDPQFVVWIQGRPFVRHAGLLKRAHECGLRSFAVAWTYNDAELSLAHAAAVFADGRRFEENGDASPQSVGKKVALHWRRCACTRASARALRLALGVDLVAIEELADE